MKALILLAMLATGGAAQAQMAFAVASIRPSAEAVQFERDGETKVLPDMLQMRDVTIETCIKWAYGVQKAQVTGPGLLTSEHYDIVAKADGKASADQMKLMMQTLLADRFKLEFHREKKELRSVALTVAKGGAKLKQAGSDEVPFRQNSATGMEARATTMQEFANFLSGPIEKPVVDKTGLAGRWDFAFDFTKYLAGEPKGPPDVLAVLDATLQGEIGLKLVEEKDVVDVMVVDRVQKPSPN